jgi:hypothetical protein
MSALASIAKLPEVKSAVLGNAAGTFLEGLREADGEGVVAVTAVLRATLDQIGELLGLGALCKGTFSGQARACLVVIHRDSVLTAFLAPTSAATKVEEILDTTLQGRS